MAHIVFALRFVLIAMVQSHSTDLGIIYGPGDLTDYLINFVNHLDPNGPTVLSWPKYAASKQMMVLQDGNTPLAVGNDTFRKDEIALLIELGNNSE